MVVAAAGALQLGSAPAVAEEVAAPTCCRMVAGEEEVAAHTGCRVLAVEEEVAVRFGVAHWRAAVEAKWSRAPGSVVVVVVEMDFGDGGGPRKRTPRGRCARPSSTTRAWRWLWLAGDRGNRRGRKW